ncbi:MAG: glycoside hydrolase family 28 protein [Prevotellaceae bacterium]|nr:glycoside hydrolase family 28 protein [Candidatus Minthosoma equi]
MKTLRTILAAMCLIASMSTFAGVWEDEYPALEKSIQSVTLKDAEFPITKYGAKTTASAKVNQKAINRAIAACSKAGGGKVIVPEGTWNTGAITMLSGVNLNIQKGATLLFAFELDLYPVVETRWEGLGCYNISPLIYANGQHDIAITGEGTIDGNGSTEAWWFWQQTKARFGWKEGMYSMIPSRAQLQTMSEDGTPISKRIFNKKNPMRPQTVNFMNCERVLIQDVTLLRSPFWVLHPVLCTDVTVRGVKVINDGPNGDGCDPESCNRVLIENCMFQTGDDCIAIKSGRNKDGRMWNVPCQNVIVRNCQMKDGHGGVVVGSEISGGYKNLFVENCQMDSPNLERVIRIKTNTCRGGIIENIYVRNVEVGECSEAVLKINLIYEPKEKAERGHIPTVRNVLLENVNCKKSKYGAYIAGLDDQDEIYNITVKRCNWTGVETGMNRIEGKSHKVIFEDVRVTK